MPQFLRRGLFWLFAGVLLLPPALVLTRLGADEGFVFTPKWSAAFALWLLVWITLALHLLAKLRFDAVADKGVAEAEAESQRRRAHAIVKADEVRAAGGDPVTDPGVQAASEDAIDAAKARASAAVRARRAGLKALVVGGDGRASTSKATAAAWTYAILFAFAYMLVLGRTLVDGPGAPPLDHLDGAFEAFVAAGFQPEYFALLGFPIGAAVTAKALNTNKTVTHTLEKSTGESTGVVAGVTELVTNDSGQSDLLDFQYFAFNLLTLAYFFVFFASDSATSPGEGLPTIPATLLSLSGVATTGYLFKKATEAGIAPEVRSVVPMRIVLGQDAHILVSGTGFLGTGNKKTRLNQVLLDGRPLVTRNWTATSVEALLPAKVTTRRELEELGWRERPAATPAHLIVRDDTGNSSPTIAVEVALPA